MTFTKDYRDPTRCKTALRHYLWLTGLDADIRMPAIVGIASRSLTFESITGATATTADLVACAVVLGQISAATSAALRGRPLDQAYETDSGWTIPDFWKPRATVLASPTTSELVTTATRNSATSVYKDANLRNFIISPHGVAVVDFDDLTLAPHGYDLAKLIISVAMTEGALPVGRIDAVLDAYNTPATQPCSRDQLAIWCEINWWLTARYVGHHYRYPWPELRPWPDPFDHRSPHGRHH